MAYSIVHVIQYVYVIYKYKMLILDYYFPMAALHLMFDCVNESMMLKTVWQQSNLVQALNTHFRTKVELRQIK